MRVLLSLPPWVWQIVGTKHRFLLLSPFCDVRAAPDDDVYDPTAAIKTNIVKTASSGRSYRSRRRHPGADEIFFYKRAQCAFIPGVFASYTSYYYHENDASLIDNETIWVVRAHTRQYNREIFFFLLTPTCRARIAKDTPDRSNSISKMVVGVSFCCVCTEDELPEGAVRLFMALRIHTHTHTHTGCFN